MNEKYWKMVHELDPKLKRSGEDSKATALLLAGLEVGAEWKKAAKEADIPQSTAEVFAKRLEANGVWKDGKTYADWNNEKHGMIAFWCDVSVALGYMEKVKA